MDRNRFRLLARGFGVLTDEEWRQTRDKLLAYLREKYPGATRMAPLSFKRNVQPVARRESTRYVTLGKTHEKGRPRAAASKSLGA